MQADTEHRRRQIELLIAALTEHGNKFTRDEIESIGGAVYTAVGRIFVNRQ